MALSAPPPTSLDIDSFTGFDARTVERIAAFFDSFVDAHGGDARFDRMLEEIAHGLRRTLSGSAVTIWVPSDPDGAAGATGVMHPAYTSLPDTLVPHLPGEAPLPEGSGANRHPHLDPTWSQAAPGEKELLRGLGLTKMWSVPIPAASARFGDPDAVIAVAEVAYPGAAPAREIPAEIVSLCGRLAGRAIERALWIEQDRLIQKGFEALDTGRSNRFAAADRICLAIAGLMRFEACTLMLADTQTRSLHVLGTTGIEARRPRRQMRYPFGFSCSGRVAREKRIIATENLDACPCFAGPRFTDRVDTPAFRQYLGAPILTPARGLLGVVRLRNKRPPEGHAGPRCLTALDRVRVERAARLLAPLMTIMVKDLQTTTMLERVRHDMDMPATMIRDGAGHLRRLPPDQLAERLDEVQQKLEDFESLAEILLLNSELLRVRDAGDLPFEPEHIMPMGQFVAKLCKMLTPAARRRDLAGILYVDDSFRSIPRLWLDPRLMQIALYNLLQNAIKYSHEGHFIVVEASQDRLDGQTWYSLHVKNTGIGVEDDQVERIWRRHYRTPQAIRKNNTGLGIGLPIARSMVERHGGRLVLSRQHNPTVFTIQLPATLAEHRPT